MRVKPYIRGTKLYPGRVLRHVWPGLVVLALLVTAGCDSSEPDLRVRDFILEDLEGNEFQLSTTQGQVVVLHFFAPWCQTCQAEAPELNAVHDALSDEGLVILGVATQAESLEQIRAFREQYDVPYKILIDDGRVATTGYGVGSFPTTYLISKDVELYGPYGALTEEELIDLLEPLL